MEANLKRDIVMRGTEASAKLLIGLMKECEIPNYIETTIIDAKDNQPSYCVAYVTSSILN